MIRPNLRGTQVLDVSDVSSDPYFHLPYLSSLTGGSYSSFYGRSAFETRMYLKTNVVRPSRHVYGQGMVELTGTDVITLFPAEMRTNDHFGIGVLLSDPESGLDPLSLDQTFDGFVYQYRMSVVSAWTVETHAQPTIFPVVVRSSFANQSAKDLLVGTSHATAGDGTAQNPNRLYFYQGAHSILPTTQYYQIVSAVSRSQIRCDAVGDFVSHRLHSTDSPFLCFGFRIENHAKSGATAAATLQSMYFSIQASYWHRSLRNADPDQ